MVENETVKGLQEKKGTRMRLREEKGSLYTTVRRNVGVHLLKRKFSLTNRCKKKDKTSAME